MLSVSGTDTEWLHRAEVQASSGKVLRGTSNPMVFLRQSISKEALANPVFWPILAKKLPGNKCMHTRLWMASTAFYNPRLSP